MAYREATCLAVAIGAILGTVAARTSAQEVEEVTVTGTRIQRAPGFSSPVPVTSLSNDEITTYAPGNTLGEALDKLPQFFATDTAQRGGHPQFSAGSSRLDMRGMGSQRTLVLIDGARTVPADISSRVNIDFIPTGLIQRVDVVTGGASAAYGADALAGVVNFVLNRDFEGFRANVSSGMTEEGDGKNWHVSLTGGEAFGQQDRLHLTWAVEGQRIDRISRNGGDGADLPSWEQNYGFVTNPEWTPGAPASVPRQLIRPHVHGTASSPTGIINGAFRRDDPLAPVASPVADFPYTRHVFTIDGSRTYPYRYGDIGCYPGDPNSPTTGQCTTQTTAGGADYGLYARAYDWGVFGDEVKRDNIFLGLKRDIGDSANVYGHVIYGYSESNHLDFRGAPTLRSPWSATVFRDNAYLPESIRDAMDATGATELQLDVEGQLHGPQFANFNDYQDNTNESETLSVTLGFEKRLFDSGNWQLSGAFQRGQTRKKGGLMGEARVDRLFLAMDAVEIYPDRRDADGDGVVDLVADADRGTGEIVCNVQRYNPTDEQLRLSVISVDEGGTRNGPTILVPAAFGDDSLADSPEDLVRIPGPVSLIDNTIENCVPINIMGTGHASPEAQDYLVSDKYDVGVVTQEYAEFVLSGNISDGIGAGPFGLAAGATYRTEKFWQRSLPRALMAFGPPTNAPEYGIRGISGGWSGNRNVHLFSDFAALTGEFSVNELFAELDLPLISTDRGRSLSANLAMRRSDYELSGAIDSWKIGIDAAITPALRFRTTVSRDVREPTFSERFDVAGGGTVVNDPFLGLTNFFTISNQLGNPALNPEKADTVTGGFVYTPQSVQGLQFAVDYYQIDLQDQIDFLPYNTVVQTCYDTRDTTRTYCDFIRRDPDTNLITIINNRSVNVASAFNSGVDFEVAWNTDVDFFDSSAETLNFRLLAGWLNENSQTPFGSPRKIERAGTSNYPDKSVLGSVTYTAGPYKIGLVTRYIPETILNMDWETRPMASCGAAACIDDNSIESQIVSNLTLGYQQDLSGGANWNVSLTVSNLFDAQPPVIATSSSAGVAQGNAPARYDIYGRALLAQFGYAF